VTVIGCRPATTPHEALQKSNRQGQRDPERVQMSELDLTDFTLKQLANHFNKVCEKAQNPYVEL
jgi:hypothetical protein